MPQDSPILFKLDKRGYVKNRETHVLEYKQNFQLGDNLLKYIKTLVGMANNKGGHIIFGIKDSPHIPIGMTNGKFMATDPAEIDRKIREYFAPELQWSMDTFSLNGREIGFLHVKEATNKPIVCQKGKQEILREGAIYYRYRAETREIEYPELRQLLDAEKEKERTLWIQHIEKIALIGPQNVHLLDSYKGEISVGDGKILIDKNILDKIHFIKEGHFTEVDGEGVPTLRLLGDIEGVADPSIAIQPDVLYPYTTKDIMEKLGLNQYHIQAILFKYRVKEKPKFHTEIRHGKSSIHKYSESFLASTSKLLEDERCLPKCIEEYQAYMKEQSKKKNLKKRR